MWNLVTHLFCFGAGTVAGVTLVCLMQAGKHEDEQMEKTRRRK